LDVGTNILNSGNKENDKFKTEGLFLLEQAHFQHGYFPSTLAVKHEDIPICVTVVATLV
jgi:hypothetical protein